MTDEYRIMLVDGDSPAIEGEPITGLVWVGESGRPSKAIIQRKIANQWEDVSPVWEIPLVSKYIVGEMNDGAVYDMINNRPSYWVKGKGWHDAT